MILYAAQILFKPGVPPNEIDIINQAHILKSIAKNHNVTSLLTFQADMFAVYAEGGLDQLAQLQSYIQSNYSVMHEVTIKILSRKYHGKFMHYIGDDLPIVNEPQIDWGISDPEVVFPYELIRKIHEINRLSK